VRYEDYAAQQAGAEAYILLRGHEIVRLKAERDALAAERDALAADLEWIAVAATRQRLKIVTWATGLDSYGLRLYWLIHPDDQQRSTVQCHGTGSVVHFRAAIALAREQEAWYAPKVR